MLRPHLVDAIIHFYTAKPAYPHKHTPSIFNRTQSYSCRSTVTSSPQRTFDNTYFFTTCQGALFIQILFGNDIGAGEKVKRASSGMMVGLL